MELREICKSKPFFKLQSTGRRKHFLRPLNLRDELWIDETYSNGFPDLSKDVSALIKVAYHQLEDKEPFKKQEVTIYDENGEKTTDHIGGINLLKTMVQTDEEKVSILSAWLEVIGISRKQQEEVVKKKII